MNVLYVRVCASMSSLDGSSSHANMWRGNGPLNAVSLEPVQTGGCTECFSGLRENNKVKFLPVRVF